MPPSNVVSLTGEDTLVLGGIVLSDFGDGDVADLKFPAELANVKAGKNGNAIYATNAQGHIAELLLRVLRGSDDDKALNAILAAQDADFSSFVLLDGQFVKRVGDGKGNVTSDTYILGGGIFTKQVEAKSNVEGDTEQSLAIYNLKFSSASRSIL